MQARNQLGAPGGHLQLGLGARLFCLKCTQFGQLVLRRITKILAIRCQILKLKCTKFDFGWGSAPDPATEFTALGRFETFLDWKFFSQSVIKLRKITT